MCVCVCVCVFLRIALVKSLHIMITTADGTHSLTLRNGWVALDSTLRDVGAEGGAHLVVSGEAPWELLSVWVTAIVLFQVPDRQRSSS